jgi:hypothetical protein
MKKLAVCHTINPNSKTNGLFKHSLPYYESFEWYEHVFTVNNTKVT